MHPQLEDAMTQTLFHTRADRYDANVTRAASLRALPGRIVKPDGSTDPGVVLFSENAFRYALTNEQALRLAHGIADAVSANRPSQ